MFLDFMEWLDDKNRSANRFDNKTICANFRNVFVLMGSSFLQRDIKKNGNCNCFKNFADLNPIKKIARENHSKRSEFSTKYFINKVLNYRQRKVS